MCVLCERESLLRLGVGPSVSVFDSMESGNNLSANQLIDEVSSSYSKSLVSTDKLMTIYLHAPGGPVQVSGGGFGVQTIQSAPIPSADQNYLLSLIDNLESSIDLDFTFVQSPNAADISIYYDTEIVLDESTDITLGLATTGTRGWELFINYPEVSDDLNYRKYILAHEFGHSLGLEHPFDDSDGDVYAATTDPWTSAYPEDTVMAYRSPLGGSWPNSFSEADLQALVQIWGEAFSPYGDGSDRVVGMSSDESFDLAGGDDWIQAGFGNDEVMGGSGADELYGNQGFDTLLGGLGNDKLYGGKEDDRLYGNQGADYLYGNLGSDLMYGGKEGDVVYGGKEDDRLYGNQGADYLYGNLGSDLIYGGKQDDHLYGNQGADYLYGNLGDDIIWGGQNDDRIDGGDGNDLLWGNKGADIFISSAGSDVINDFSSIEGDCIEVEGAQPLGYEQVDFNLIITHSQGSLTLTNTIYEVGFFEAAHIVRV